MLSSIKHINPAELDESGLREALVVLLNIVEQLSQGMEELRQRNQALEDENNKLKGGNARPQITPSAQSSKDISSKGKEKGHRGGRRRMEEKVEVEIDRELVEKLYKTSLPSDSVFKGYREYIQQDLLIKRDNKKYKFESYYSASMGRAYVAGWPPGVEEGHYGYGVRSLVNVLYHFGNMTEGSIEVLMKSLGIVISAGTVSNLLKREHSWAVEEQQGILQAALAVNSPKQMDATGNRQKGINKTTHIITGEFFSVFYTLDGKSRLDCLRALQGNPTNGIYLMWQEHLQTALHGKVAAADLAVVKSLMEENREIKLADFDALLKDRAPKLFAKSNAVAKLRDAMALTYYAAQQAFPRPTLLLSDNAPEYGKIALYHALCWVHDARYYNKLFPKIALHEQKLNDFKSQYWNFYRQLLDFKELPASEQAAQKILLTARFDQLFDTQTKYGALDLEILRTKANKEELLRVLDFPDTPLHNNAAELGARKIVRKRDISLHTWSDWGTQLRDAFLSIIETAKKLGISVFHLILDRISNNKQIPLLGNIILNRFTPTF